MAAAPAVFLGLSAATAIGGTVVGAIGQSQQAKQNAQAAMAQGSEQARAARMNAANVLAQSEEAARAAEANAAIAREQARIVRQQASQERERATIEADVFERQSRREMGGRVAAVAGSGFTLSGSFIDLLADAALEDEQQRLFILTDGEQRAQARLAGATIEEMTATELERQAVAQRETGAAMATEFLRGGAAAAGVARSTAGAIRTAGTLGTIGTIIGGASQLTQLGLVASQSPSFRRAFSNFGRRSSVPTPTVSPAGGFLNPRTGMFGRV
jgi:hypothetical protein